MFAILVIFALGLLSYYYLIKPKLYWSSKNVKQGFPKPILGDSWYTTFKLESMVDFVKRNYNVHKELRYYGIYQVGMPTLILNDPDLIKQLTVKDFDHFVDHLTIISEDLDPIWTKNLFALQGDKWREMRATLSPTFTASKMRLMFNLMEKSAQQYVKFYSDQKKDVIELELKDSFSRFANDVIANCAFGVTVDSLKDPTNEFFLKGKSLTDFTGLWKNIQIVIMLISPKLADVFGFQFFAPETGEFFKSLIRDTVRVREEQNIVRPDMINLLMEARKGKLKYEESTEQKDAGFATAEESHVGKNETMKQVALTEEDMAAQVLIFFFAGFDTISTVMSFIFFELAVHPDIQDKLRQEVDETYEECKGKLTYDLLSKMKYLDMVTSESLRKHPALPTIDRICTKPYTIQPERPGEKPVHLKVGEIIWLPVLGLHHDEQYYPNPEKFDPERFSDENKANIKPYTYLPFGSGPRNCIGSRFALMEVKTLIFHVLSKFELTVIEKTSIPIKYDKWQFSPYIEGGFWVGFKRRENIVTL